MLRENLLILFLKSASGSKFGVFVEETIDETMMKREN